MQDEDEAVADRRKFLAAAGKFAVTVPPAMTFLLTTTLSSNAIASSCNRGLGQPSGGEFCDPGNSGGKPGAAGDPNEQNNPRGGGPPGGGPPAWGRQGRSKGR
jgi:hypothetical protein